jgi:hypothetical protein
MRRGNIFVSLPTVIGIGAQKCASTWIYDVLSDHPQVRMSTCKELDFFSYHYDRGLSWYERHFGRSEPGFAVGEISPSYFHEPAVPERVQAFLPNVKIVVALRDPAERAFSHHRHAVRLGDVKGSDLSFETALPRNPMYLEQGRYATHLQRWLDRFSEEQLLILLFEEVARAPDVVAGRLYRFLDIDPGHLSSRIGQRSNESHTIPFHGLERTRKALRAAFHRTGLGAAWDGVAASGGRRLYHRLNRQPSDRTIPPLKNETRAWLRAYFRDEVLRLEVLTGRNLSDWYGVDETSYAPPFSAPSASFAAGA